VVRFDALQFDKLLRVVLQRLRYGVRVVIYTQYVSYDPANGAAYRPEQEPPETFRVLANGLRKVFPVHATSPM
jgi:hypothetical protein